MKDVGLKYLLGATLGVVMVTGTGHAASIDPATFSATIGVGETIMVDKTITLDDAGPALSKVDVFFLADNTGSMGGIINTVRNNASSILGSIAGGDPRFSGIDVGFGVGRYLGDPRESVPPNTAYQLQQSITTSQAATQTAINNWFASGGGDTPEANFFALHQVATEGGSTDGLGSTDPGISTGQVTGWRDGAGKVIVWFGDAVSHITTVDQAEAIAALTDNDVTVAAINTQSANSGIDQAGQASAVAAATGGTLTNNVSGTSTTVDAILDAIEAATSTIDLLFAAVGDTSGLDVSYACTDVLGCTDVGPGESRDFKMTVVGLTPGTYEFDTTAIGVAGAVEEDTITVTEDGSGPGPGPGPGGDVPEPSMIALLGFAALGLGAFCRTRRRHV